MHKDILPKKEVLDEIYAQSNDISGLSKSFIASTPKLKPKKRNYLLAKGYYYEDSSHIRFKSLNLFYRRNRLSENLDMGVDGGLFSIEDETRRHKGTSVGISAFFHHFSLRLGENIYDDFSEFVPTLSYQNVYKRHSYILEYTKKNALFYTYSLCPYEKKISTHHLSASDYIALSEKSDIWSMISVDFFSNRDISSVLEFDYKFFDSLDQFEKLRYSFSVDGWYNTYTKTNNCFYSPKFDDSTMLRIDPSYPLSKYASIRARFGLGYAFYSKSQVYKYGLWLSAQPIQNLSYEIGCQKSNSSRSGFGAGFYYNECEANVGFKW